ncbi:MAG: hypothetical protein ACE5ID_05115 [Acidobacteriota bacterium]
MEQTPDETASLLPLARAGRIFHYRGRSRVDSSSPNQAPVSQFGYLLSTHRVVQAGDDAVPLLLQQQSFIYLGRGRSSLSMSTPMEKREASIQIHRPAFEVQVEDRTTAPRLGPDRFGEPLRVSYTDDGFGLNASARRHVLLYSLALPSALFARLHAGRTIERSFDFYLVREDPGADGRVVPVPADPAPPPAGAERRIHGTTRLTPKGTESYWLTWRFTVPPDPGDKHSPPAEGYPDRRLALPALRVDVEVQMTIRTLGESRSLKDLRRSDRLAWMVLDRPDEPWLLSWDGRIHTISGNPQDPSLVESFVSRALFRMETDPAP